MLFRGPKLNKVSGTVFHDKNNNGIQDNGEAGIPGVGLILYANKVDSKSSINGITVRKGFQVSHTCSGRDGRFKVLVPGGDLTLSVNVKTLPEGKGVVNKDFAVSDGKTDYVDIPISDITGMDMKGKRRFSMGEEIKSTPVLTNATGDIMHGNCKLSYDGIRRVLSARSGSIVKEFKIGIIHPAVSIVGSVDAEYRSKLISRHEKIRLLLYSLFDRSKLPHGFGGIGIPVKSGTIVLEQVKEYIGSRFADRELTGEILEYLRNSLPELDMTYKSQSGFFRIHYTTSGKHAVPYDGTGVPEYIMKVGEAFDNVREVTCNKRGFRAPNMEKGKSAYDVYVYDLNGVYGYTAATGYHKPVDSRIAATSYIAIDNDYSSSKGFVNPRDDSMRVTAAHEFFHAVQYAYNAKADKWWKEASATWNEDEIYPMVNDYIRYLGDYFSTPNRSIESYTYSAVLFAKYISEHLGGYETIKRIWERQVTTDKSIKAIDKALESIGENAGLAEALNRFSAFNFNPVQYYEDGGLWKDGISVQNTFSDYPVGLQTNKLDHLATDYQLFRCNGITGKKIGITVDGSTLVKWGMKIQKRRKADGMCDITYIKPDVFSERMEIIIDKPDRYNDICFIPSNLDKRRDGAAYQYSVKLL